MSKVYTVTLVFDSTLADSPRRAAEIIANILKEESDTFIYEVTDEETNEKVDIDLSELIIPTSISITAIDSDTSETRSRSFETTNLENFKASVLAFESELDYRRYSLETYDDIPEGSKLEEILNELEVIF